MVAGIRNIEKAISGNGEKNPSKSELKNIVIARKRIHLKRDLEKGTVIGENDIIALRPANGISPMKWNDVIGKTLRSDKNKFYRSEVHQHGHGLLQL